MWSKYFRINFGIIDFSDNTGLKMAEMWCSEKVHRPVLYDSGLMVLLLFSMVPRINQFHLNIFVSVWKNVNT